MNMNLKMFNETSDKDDRSLLSAKSIQIMKDKPLGWEYLLFSELLNDYIKECEDIKRDLVHGNPLLERIVLEDPIEIVRWVKEHFNLLESIIHNMTRLINDEFRKAVGEPGQLGDAKKINYVAKEFIEGYKSIIRWRLRFYTLNIDPSFSNFLNLTSNLASNAIKETEEFVKRFYKETNEIFNDSYNDEEGRTIRFNINLGIPDSPEFNNEIDRVIKMIGEDRIASNNKNISNNHENQDEQSRTVKDGTVKRKRLDSVKQALPYKIVDDHTYENAIRIRTKWKGKNRLLWIDKSDINEFLSHPENFKEIPKLFDSGKQWRETGGRIKMGSGGTVLRWNACIVKKVGFFQFFFGK